MNTRSAFLIGTLAGLVLIPPACAVPPTAAAAQADTPAVAVVREFLADRTAGKYAAAYALLSADFRQSEPEEAFAKGGPIPAGEAANLPASLVEIVVLFSDPHNALGRTFTVLGSDPTLPGAVLVRSTLIHSKPPSVTFSLLTISDPVTHAPRLDPQGSLKHASPKAFFAEREKARQATSLSNLRQLALGVIQYGQDHDEKMPDAAHWVDEILPYVKTEVIFHDPSVPADEKWSYAFNRTLSHQPLAALDAPAQTVLLFESNSGVKNASDTGQSVPVPGRHLGGTDYALADGHAKWFKDGTKLSYRLDAK